MFKMSDCVQIVGVLLVLTVSVNGHVFKLGSCPRVEAVESFDYDKFLGPWYVIEKFDTSSSCMMYEFAKRGDGSKYVREKSHPMGIDTFGKFSQTGEITMAEGETQGKMAIQYPLSINPFSPADHVIMMTDYETYAGIWSCRRILFGSYMSGMILSRQRSLDRAIINKIRSRFEFYGVNKSDLSVVEQEGCESEVPKGDGGEPGLRIPAIITQVYNNETELVATLKPGKPKQFPRPESNVP